MPQLQATKVIIVIAAMLYDVLKAAKRLISIVAWATIEWIHTPVVKIRDMAHTCADKCIILDSHYPTRADYGRRMYHGPTRPPDLP